MTMTPMLYILGTALSSASIYFGWGGEGYIHKTCLIVGGVYFGFLITEALNYVDRGYDE